MSHIQIGCREEVDSQLLVVGSQTASLTPGPSFAHNLGCRCPNCQCEAIFDIYVSRNFQWHQEHPNARCFGPLLSSFEHSGVPEDSQPPTFPSVGLHPYTWPKWGCDSLGYAIEGKIKWPFNLLMFHMLTSQNSWKVNEGIWAPLWNGMFTKTFQAKQMSNNQLSKTTSAYMVNIYGINLFYFFNSYTKM